MKTLIFSHYQRVKNIYLRWERWLLPTTLVVGFLLDYVTFSNINISLTLALLGFYWIIAGATITFSHFFDIGALPKKFQYARLFAPLLIQFLFGALLSSSLVFYWLSGAFSVSWPIIAIIVLLMVFNDMFRHYFVRPMVQFGVYFFITLSLASLALPFIFNSLSPWLFVLAGFSSFVIFCAYVNLLPKMAWQQRRILLMTAVIITISMNVLYVGNIIPPIPLFLREAGMYHSITPVGNSYVLGEEPETLWQKIIPGQTLHMQPGGKVYCYTAIFAPAKLTTTIFHHWQYYDKKQKKWIEKGRPSFQITGGRQEGYKGYSWHSQLTEGSWRIYVKNQRGQVLGKIRFTVEQIDQTPKLQETVR